MHVVEIMSKKEPVCGFGSNCPVGGCSWKTIKEFWHVNPIPGQCAHISTALTQSCLRTSLSLQPESQPKSSTQHLCSAGTERAPECYSRFQLARSTHQPLTKALVFSCSNPELGQTAWLRENQNQTEEHLWVGVSSRAARGLQQGPPSVEPAANLFSSALSSRSSHRACRRAGAFLGISSLLTDNLHLCHARLLHSLALARGLFLIGRTETRGRAFGQVLQPCYSQIESLFGTLIKALANKLWCLLRSVGTEQCPTAPCSAVCWCGSRRAHLQITQHETELGQHPPYPGQFLTKEGRAC